MGVGRKGLVRLVALLFVGVVSLSAALYARDETLAPCGMLRSEMKRSVLSLVEREGFAYRRASVDAAAISAAQGYNMIDAATSRYGEMTCARLLVRLNLRGEMPSGVTLPRDSAVAAGPEIGIPLASSIGCTSISTKRSP
jgi:hypothetical protein